MKRISKDHWDPTLYETFQGAMEFDPDGIKAINYLALQWEDFSEEKKNHINIGLITICGWSLETLMKSAETGKTLDEVS